MISCLWSVVYAEPSAQIFSLYVHPCSSVVKFSVVLLFHQRRKDAGRAPPAPNLLAPYTITIESTRTNDGRFDDARGVACAGARARPGGTLLRRPRGSRSCTPWRSSENDRGSHSSAAGDTHDRTSRRSSRLPNRRANRRGIRGQTGAASGFGIHASRVNVHRTLHVLSCLSAWRSDRSPSAAPTCQVEEFRSPTRRLTSYAGSATRSDPLHCV